MNALAHCGVCVDYANRRVLVLTKAVVETANRHGVDGFDLIERYMSGYHEQHCWCGTIHPEGFWHDPTHGRIDRDIQDKIRARYGDDLGIAERVAIESTTQSRRDQGLSI